MTIFRWIFDVDAEFFTNVEQRKDMKNWQRRRHAHTRNLIHLDHFLFVEQKRNFVICHNAIEIIHHAHALLHLYYKYVYHFILVVVCALIAIYRSFSFVLIAELNAFA